MTEQYTNWIASRNLTDQATGEKVVVSLAWPERVSAEEWRCGFQIEGIASEQIRHAHGLDAFQALILAIEGIHFVLASSNRQLTWEGGEPGDTGFPRFVPQAFGLSFARKISCTIDEALRRFTEQARERVRMKKGPSKET